MVKVKVKRVFLRRITAYVYDPIKFSTYSLPFILNFSDDLKIIESNFTQFWSKRFRLYRNRLSSNRAILMFVLCFIYFLNDYFW